MKSEPIPSDRIAQLRVLLAAATPGPWRPMIEGRDHESGDSFIMTGKDGSRGPDLYVTGSSADLDLIAVARNLLPELLDELERLQARGVAAE